MKTIFRMQMQACCCMMEMTTNGNLYIIGINKEQKKQYEKISINNRNIIEHQYQPYLG